MKNARKVGTKAAAVLLAAALSFSGCAQPAEGGETSTMQSDEQSSSASGGQISSSPDITAEELMAEIKTAPNGAGVSVHDPSIKKFDGEPIFRNKKILITGKFVNGNLDDIAAILASYSAEVVRKFDPDVDCVVTGGQVEDINGTYLRQAKLRNIPVYDELSFFKTYEIDQDLVQNLL